ncbi:MAG: DMT family transporter [Rhodospirillales bacterium]
MHPAASADAARRRATLVGAGALLLWATLASTAALTARIPPFQLVALAFALAGVCGAAIVAARGGLRAALRQPAAAWAHGIGGLFGYHFCYFVALRNAPAAEANLVNYLWPLLIVVFSAALPGERLRAAHVAGVAMGFAGVSLLLAGGEPAPAETEAALGYAAAFAAALVWSSYSVSARLLQAVPTAAVAGFCVATAVLSAACHVLWEATVMPTAFEWLVVGAIGLGPLGAAFFLWDHAVKRGDIRVLGLLSYATPLLSTLLLIGAGLAPATWAVAGAAALIVGGAAVGTGFGRRRAARPR